MNAWVVAAVLAAGVFAGCLSGPDGATADDDGLEAGVPDTVAFRYVDDAAAWVPAADAPGIPHRFYTNQTGAEPNIGITTSGALFVTAFTRTLKSVDRGQTWDLVHDFRMLQGQSTIGTSDPMLWVDTATDRVFVNHMWGLNCFNMLWSDDEGATWFQRDLACATPSVDHQKVTTGPPGPGPNPFVATMPLYPSVVYTCYNKYQIGATNCFMSYDGGLTYPLETIVFRRAEHGCGGPAGHPAVHSDGTIALAYGWNCGPIVGVSRDSGLTWTVHRGPEGYGSSASIDPELAWGPDGSLYLMWRAEDHLPRIARSTDRGATWDAVWDITAPGLTSTRFKAMSAGSEGRLAAAYLGTSYAPGPDEEWDFRPTTAPPTATWHLYVVTLEGTHTDAPIITSYQVTPEEDPVQIGCSWEGGGGGGPRACRNMLDFIDSAVAPDGTFFVTYTEGCTPRNGCAAGSPEADSRDRMTAVARLDGWSMLAS